MKAGSSSADFQTLPRSLEEAANIARQSNFVANNLPLEIRKDFFSQLDKQIQEYNLAKDKDDFEEKTYFRFI